MRGRQGSQAGGAGGLTTYKALQGADAAWTKMRNMPTGEAAGPAPTFVRESAALLGLDLQYDVVVCGGTLGVFIACALQVRMGPYLTIRHGTDLCNGKLCTQCTIYVLSQCHLLYCPLRVVDYVQHTRFSRAVRCKFYRASSHRSSSFLLDLIMWSCLERLVVTVGIVGRAKQDPCKVAAQVEMGTVLKFSHSTGSPS